MRYTLAYEDFPTGGSNNGTIPGDGGCILVCKGGSASNKNGVGMFGYSHNIKESGTLVLYKSTVS